MMRVTNNIIQSNATLTPQLGLQRMAQSQMQVSTGQKFSSFADDPQRSVPLRAGFDPLQRI